MSRNNSFVELDAWQVINVCGHMADDLKKRQQVDNQNMIENARRKARPARWFRKAVPEESFEEAKVRLNRELGGGRLFMTNNRFYPSCIGATQIKFAESMIRMAKEAVNGIVLMTISDFDLIKYWWRDHKDDEWNPPEQKS